MEFFDKWVLILKREKSNAISNSTINGLFVTLRGTLQLIKYVHSVLNYDYLLTTKLTQDALEVRIIYNIYNDFYKKIFFNNN